ncbi:5531_t:CDS:2, partial [Acaulospora morrowiae]
MDLYSKLTENQQQFKSGEIDEDEFKKRKKLILDKWTDKPKKTKKLEHSYETDLYAVLQLTPSATETEIKSSYKKLALKYHPDKNGGVETEEWTKLSKAYQILSDENSRILYDNHGIVSDAFANKASFNCYVGGELWKPYIGDLEIGLWMYSFIDSNSLSELEHVTSAEQKERRHVIRVSNIVRHLQDKLSQFPVQNNSSEFESFKQSLYQEVQKLLAEPNGKELLSLLGEIYISESKTYLSRFSINILSNLFNSFTFTYNLIHGFVTIKASNLSGMKQEEIIKITWRLSRSEISSITYET